MFPPSTRTCPGSSTRLSLGRGPEGTVELSLVRPPAAGSNAWRSARRLSTERPVVKGPFCHDETRRALGSGPRAPMKDGPAALVRQTFGKPKAAGAGAKTGTFPGGPAGGRMAGRPDEPGFYKGNGSIRGPALPAGSRTLKEASAGPDVGRKGGRPRSRKELERPPKFGPGTNEEVPPRAGPASSFPGVGGPYAGGPGAHRLDADVPP